MGLNGKGALLVNRRYNLKNGEEYILDVVIEERLKNQDVGKVTD